MCETFSIIWARSDLDIFVVVGMLLLLLLWKFDSWNKVDDDDENGQEADEEVVVLWKDDAFIEFNE